MPAESRLKIILVGVGKIARDQHLPTIAVDNRFELVATVGLDEREALRNIPFYSQMSEAFECHPNIEAVVLCTPPKSRYALAVEAITAGKHVFLEKPPAVGIAQAAAMMQLARECNVTLFTAWHSQFAAGVEPAGQWLADQAVISVKISWKEDVRRWHPGQDWIFEPGGMGVFDPAINAFSIATAILPQSFSFTDGTMNFPSNRKAPISARLRYADSFGAPVDVELDFLQQGDEQWTIDVLTPQDSLCLSRGGELLSINGRVQHVEPQSEYAAMYDRFIQCVEQGEQHADIQPLVHVADAFILSDRQIVEAFHW